VPAERAHGAPEPSPARGRLAILGAAALFSTGGAAIKACTLSSWQVAAYRSGIAAVALGLVLGGARDWRRRRPLAVGLAYAATMILFVTANKLTTSANTIFLQSTAPMYLLALGPWLLGEPVRRADLLFASALAVGMALFFVGSEPPLVTAPDPLSGNVLAALSGLTWALTILGLRWIARHEGGRQGAAAAVMAGNIMACLASLPFALLLKPSAIGPADGAILLYLGVFQIGLAYVLMTRGVRDVPALEVSLLLLLEPVLNPLWAALAHGERPGRFSLAGSAIILVSTLARVLAGARRERRPERAAYAVRRDG
jgi:drug/metabolite transporter (DMT)-like permease